MTKTRPYTIIELESIQTSQLYKQKNEQTLPLIFVLFLSIRFITNDQNSLLYNYRIRKYTNKSIIQTKKEQTLPLIFVLFLSIRFIANDQNSPLYNYRIRKYTNKSIIQTKKRANPSTNICFISIY